MSQERWRGWVLGGVTAAALVLTLQFLHLAQVFFIPTILAIYISMMVMPVHAWLSRRLPRKLGFLATALTSLLPVAAIGVFVLVAWWAGRQVSAQGAQWQQRLLERWNQLRDWLQSQGITMDQFFDQSTLETLIGQLVGPITSLLSATANLLLGLALVLFLIVLLLSERRAWRHKAEATLDVEDSDRLDRIAREAARKVRLFLLWRTATGLISAVMVAAWTWALGVALVPLWFLLQWLLNYIPNIGSIVAGLFPVAFAFVQYDWQTGLYVALGIFAIEQFVGNYLDPKLQGRGLSLSPAAVLMAVLLFGWMWGIIGTLFAAPLLATLHAIARHVPELEPLAVYIGRDPEEERAEEADG